MSKSSGMPLMSRVVIGLTERTRSIVDRTLVPSLVRMQGAEIGSGTRFVGMPQVLTRTGGTISFGSNCLIISKQARNFLTGACRFVLMAQGAEILLEDDVGVSGLTVFSTISVRIGTGTIVGGDSMIMDSDFHPLDPDQRRIDRNKGAKQAPIVLGNNVFVGARAIILRGTEIGEGSVVGAGAVVAGRFPPNSLIAGNPARLVRALK